RHGGLDGFLAHFEAAQRQRDDKLLEVMDMVAMAACYSPNASAPHGIDFPCDLETGRFRPAVWSRWLAHDPLRMLDEPKHVEALAGMRLVYLDCGTRDEFALDVGARAFAARLREAGVGCVHEEFDDGHM